MAHSLQLLKKYNIVLASTSPRRAQLLRLIGVDFEVRASSVLEDNGEAEEPRAHVQRLALAKAQQIAAQVERGIVIGADTIVVVEGCILGKPRDRDEAKAMLATLSGRTHKVYTGFALVCRPRGEWTTDFEVTSVHFRHLSAEEIELYVQDGSPLDKAGAYGIQDFSALFVDRIEGCFYNVVGFPLAKFYVTLKNFTESLEEEL